MNIGPTYRQIIVFIIVVLGLSYFVFWGPIVLLKLRTANLVEGKIYNVPAFILFIIGGFVPSLAGIVLTRIFDGKAGLKELLGSAIKFRIDITSCIIIVVYPFLVGIFQLILNRLLGGSFDYQEFIRQLPTLLPLIILGPLSEEFGWRGFLQKRIHAGFHAVPGSILIGTVWALWHLPLFYMSGTSQHDFNLPFLPFLVSLISVSFVYTYLYLRSGRSLFAAILMHWVATYFMQVIASKVTRSTAYNLLECLPALAIGIIFIILLWHRGRERTY